MAAASIDNAMGSAKVSLALEGIMVSEEQEQLVKAVLEGRLTDEEFMERVHHLIDENRE